jgi:hypothetical protein
MPGIDSLWATIRAFMHLLKMCATRYKISNNNKERRRSTRRITLWAQRNNFGQQAARVPRPSVTLEKISCVPRVPWTVSLVIETTEAGWLEIMG